MPDVNQQGGRFVQGGDIPVKNYGTADIPAGTAVLWDTANVAGSTQCAGVYVPAAAGAITGTAGITIDDLTYTNDLASGIGPMAGRLRRAGSAVCTADGAITAGNFVMVSSTAGKMGRVKAYTGAAEYIGTAENTAADGGPVLVNISIGKGA